MKLTRDLAKFIRETDFHDLPEEVIFQAKRCFLDWLGGALAASQEKAVQMILAVARATGGYPQASIVGNYLRTSALTASCMNGVMGHLLECDDCHSETLMHPSSPILPALLALSEWRGIGGQDFLLSFVLGYEVQARIGMLMMPSHYELGWHSTGTLGTIGAAASTAKLLNLSEKQIVYSLGIAATQAAGLCQSFGSMARSLHVGKASMNGLIASLLAEQGFTCTEDVIEGEKGFMKLFSWGKQLKSLPGLGREYQVFKSFFRAYACPFFLHPVVEAILRLRRN